jgi:hypothetical protein
MAGGSGQALIEGSPKTVRMMENQYEKDFERLLKENADGFRMYPSPKTWDGIYERLHGKKRMLAVGLLALLFLLGLIFTPNNKSAQTPADTAYATNNHQGPAVSASPNGIGQNTPDLSITPVIGNKPVADIISYERPAPVTLLRQSVPAPRARSNNPAGRNNRIRTGRTTNTIADDGGPIEAEAIAETVLSPETKTEEALTITPITILKESGNEEETAPVEKAEEPAHESQQSASMASLLLTEDRSEKHAEASSPKQSAGGVRSAGKEHRLVMQMHATSSLSYRKKTDMRDKSEPSTYTDEELDKALFQTPSMGFELGVNWLYALTPRSVVKAGVQLNYNRYNIKASESQPEAAEIRLFGNNNQIYPVTTLRNPRRENGFLPQWLENKNLQLSLPVGMEYVLSGQQKSQINVGLTLQPSYLLREKNYILSTDLKNYAEESSLIRRFNLNAAFEIFFSMNTEKFRWHVGPQLRYQLFSTYDKAYPFRENLIDYGFKIGVSKPFRLKKNYPAVSVHP